MLEENKEEILDRNYYINKRQNVRLKKRALARKNRLFILAIVTSFILIIALYLCLPISNVKHVSIVGNRYLDDAYYRNMSQISDSDKYLLSFNTAIEKEFADCDLIEGVKVKHLNHNVIQIEIDEKDVVAYIQSDIPSLLIKDGSELRLKKDYNDIILNVPLIEGYSKEELQTIVKGFNDLDMNMINEISEIHKYPFSYDDQMMELIMRDGNYVYLSYYAMPLLNDYYLMVSGIDKSLGKPCIYIDEMSNSAYTSDCPFWGETELETDGEQNESVQDAE